VYSSSSVLESVFTADEIGAYRNYVLIESSKMKSPIWKENSTEISNEYVLNKHSFSMFNTGTGFNLVAYLQEKLYENEFSTFKYDKSLIDAAIIEYHKYLELTKNWLNNNDKNNNNNKYVYIPSKVIDFVWHWHILQTYEYYLMCNKQFNGIFLHHRPYFGAEKQSTIYKHRINKYKKTLIDYKNYFGYYPPNIIWGKHDKPAPAPCDEMHACDSLMMADCQMHACDSEMIANCDEMHACDSLMMADCEEMHQCDSHMILVI